MANQDDKSTADDEHSLHAAIAAAPRDAALHVQLGHFLFEKGDFARAAGAYQKAAELDSRDWKTFYNLGVALSRLARHADALAAQRQALALNPSSPEALAQAGLLLHKTGDNIGALEMLDRAVAAAPSQFEPHYYRGTVLAAEGRIADAATAQASAISASPSRFEGHLALGKLFVRLGREDEALAAYRRAVESNPGALATHDEFNNLAWEMGMDVRQLGSHAFARARIGETPEFLLAEAELRLRFRNPSEAARAEALLAHAGDGADVANARGRAIMLQNRLAEAADQFCRAIAAEPASISHRQYLAMTLLRDCDATAAHQVLREAFAMAADDQLTLALLNLAARALGDDTWLGRMAVDGWVQEIALPVPSGFVDMAAFNAALAEELMSLHTRKAAPMDQSLNHGTKTPGAHLFARKSRLLSLLEDGLRHAVAGYIAGLPEDASHPFLARRSGAFDFSGSWSGCLNSKGYHTNHIHPKGWISSAYYVDLPPDVAAGFENQGALKFGESPFGLGKDDRPSRVVTPAVGKLVLFPSYFWHGTVRFMANRPRLTVAFDVVPR
ncbi:MAG TPA: putative 2OG-Fe(II) oxygenase [Rhizomicrobium sp.]|nr:putative 2OG-Fe(II) oxygenase [Rhizomicrobium sp.]